MKCPKCNAENPETQSFCGDCGTQLGSDKDIPVFTKTLETPFPQLEKGRSLASRYEIIEELGRGGMGEVYLAEDTNLKRKVAIKVLPQPFALDKERLARFEREARLLASLNHPNIATIHGLEKSDDHNFLVMEYIEGDTLAERITKGPIPMDEALEICHQLAEGLESAHDKGIIHRDLKPANLKVTPDGKVKILDFGIAKAFQDQPDDVDPSKSPAISDEMTRPGMILGTAAYMSPEQTKGKDVDKRTDIWAFGCILYECLTGKRAFKGEEISEMLASILKDEPDLGKLSEDTSNSIRRLLRRCLEKDPKQRLRDIGDARIEIGEMLRDQPSILEEPELPYPKQSRISRIIPWAIVAVLALITVLSLWLTRKETAVESLAVNRFTISLPNFTEHVSSMAFSRDGQHLIYNGLLIDGRSCLYHRALDQMEIQFVNGTEYAEFPFFSPDGNWIGFYAKGRLKKVPLSGGPPITICETKEAWGASWGKNDEIVFGGPGTGLFRAPASGGTRTPLTNLKTGEKSHRWPQVLPDGNSVIFVIWTTGELDDAKIGLLSLETGEYEVLIDNGHGPIYSNTGHLLFTRSGALMAATFDPDTPKEIGDPIPLLEDMTPMFHGGRLYEVSEDGTILYPSGQINPLAQTTLVWVDRQGKTAPVLPGRIGFSQPRFSPDGKRLSLTAIPEDGIMTIFTFDIAREALTQIVTEGFGAWSVWAPDGQHVAYTSDWAGQWNVWLKSADGSGKAEQVTFSEIDRQRPISWSSNGILAFQQGEVGVCDLWVLPLKDKQKAESFLATQFNETGAKFSPDGNWMSFTSDRSGQDEVYVMPFRGLENMIQISTDGGKHPVWARDGKELFYRNGNQMMAVPIQIEPEFKAGKPILLFEGSFSYGYLDWSHSYDISPDGQRFVMAIKGDTTVELNVVLNWSEELKRIVPVRK